MTWCPLLCYPLSPSPVNIERFFKLGAKFCRKIYSSQALNCFLLLVHTASSFATGQIDVSERVPMFEDDNLDDLDIGFPSPTAPSSPGTRASSLEVPEARGKGQEEDFGECCSRLSLQVFGVVSRFGVVWIYHWQLSLFRVLNTRCLPPIELPTSGNMTAPVQITQLSTRLPSPSLPVLRGKEKHK